MLRAKKLRTAFLFLPFVFCLYLSGVSVADDSCFQALSTIPGNVKYFFEWDPTNPEEINPNSNVEIKVIGGKSPYIWAVKGNGFSLSQNQSNGVSNILTADSTACGACHIKVTDACGNECTGVIRSTAGEWVLYETCTPAFSEYVWTNGCATCVPLGTDYVQGDVKYFVDGGYEFYPPSGPSSWWVVKYTTDPCGHMPPCGTPILCGLGPNCVVNYKCYAISTAYYKWECIPP